MARVAKADGKCRFRVLPLGGLDSNSLPFLDTTDRPRLISKYNTFYIGIKTLFYDMKINCELSYIYIL